MFTLRDLKEMYTTREFSVRVLAGMEGFQIYKITSAEKEKQTQRKQKK